MIMVTKLVTTRHRRLSNLLSMRVMRFLMTEITEQSVEAIRGTLGEDVICELMEWQNIGGQATIDEFHKLGRDRQEDIIEYLGEFVPYMEVRVGDNDFVIVHAGLNNFISITAISLSIAEWGTAEGWEQSGWRIWRSFTYERPFPVFLPALLTY